MPLTREEFEQLTNRLGTLQFNKGTVFPGVYAFFPGVYALLEDFTEPKPEMCKNLIGVYRISEHGRKPDLECTACGAIMMGKNFFWEIGKPVSIPEHERPR